MCADNEDLVCVTPVVKAWENSHHVYTRVLNVKDVILHVYNDLGTEHERYPITRLYPGTEHERYSITRLYLGTEHERYSITRL